MVSLALLVICFSCSLQPEISYDTLCSKNENAQKYNGCDISLVFCKKGLHKMSFELI